jgi:hypothetical protein
VAPLILVAALSVAESNAHRHSEITQLRPVWEGITPRQLQASGLTVHELTTSPSSSRPGLVLVWTVLRNTSVTVVDVRQFGPSGEIYAKNVQPSAVAAINGGFFGYSRSGKYMPLGLVVSHGRKTSPLAPWRTGGVMYQDLSNEVRVAPVRAFRLPPSTSQALQSKPLLVEGGRVAIRSEDSRFNRSAVGLASDGAIVLAGTFESFGRAMSLKEFATFLVALEQIGGVRVLEALAMDGGPGAHLYFPALSKHYGDPGKNYIPNLIALGR